MTLTIGQQIEFNLSKGFPLCNLFSSMKLFFTSFPSCRAFAHPLQRMDRRQSGSFTQWEALGQMNT